MEFHSFPNCWLIKQAISKEIKKFDSFRDKNLGLLGTYINSHETITGIESEIAKLRTALLAERQRNLHIYVQQQTNDSQKRSQTSMYIVGNPEPEQSHRTKYPRKCRTESVPTSISEKTDFISLSKYNELMSLMEKRKRMHEADLDFVRSLSDKYKEKLKQEIADLHERLSIMLEKCKTSWNDLFKERKEYIELCKLLQDGIKTMNNSHANQLDIVKKKMKTEATNTANAHTREAVSPIKIQLAEKDRVVKNLRREVLIKEASVEKQKQQLCKQQENNSIAIGELERELRNAKHKYRMLELRRSLEGQGFRTDVTNIRKDLKQVKNKLGSAEHNCESYSDILN